MQSKTYLALSICAMLAHPALADPVEIVDVTARQDSQGWTFDVTLLHPDTGWDHYADAWEVLGPDGTSLGIRELVHPHVDEQPFTRSLSGVAVPDDVDHVLIRARCLVDGWSAVQMQVDLKR